MSVLDQTEVIVSLTDKAALQAREMLEKEENPAGKGLRFYVESGGCSGYQYGMTFDEKREGDFTTEFNGVPVLVDNVSAEYNLKLRVRDGIVRVIHLNNGGVVHDGINNEGYLYVGGQVKVKKNKRTGKLEYSAQVTISSTGIISTYTINIEKEAADVPE